MRELPPDRYFSCGLIAARVPPHSEAVLPRRDPAGQRPPGSPAGTAGEAAPTGPASRPRTAAYDAAVPRRRSSRALRYSATTISVSSSAEVSELRLSKVILPSWIMFTRSDTSSTWP